MMFRTAELGQSVPKEEFERRQLVLRQQLVELQQRLRSEAQFSVIIDFAGVDGGGKADTVNLLHKWMDPRWLVTRAFGEPSDEERQRPEFWRFWRNLPPKGRIGLFLSGRYSGPLLDRVYDRISNAEFEERLEQIDVFEKELADDGALILKFWMHLSSSAQKKRLKALEKDPLESWRVKPSDWEHWRMYGDFIKVAERIITRTSTSYAPWLIVEAVDRRYRSLTVGEKIRESIVRHCEMFETRGEVAAEERPSEQDVSPSVTIFDKLESPRALTKKEYRRRLKKYQGKAAVLNRRAFEQKRSVVLVFEGPDAAGKGGAIRRLAAALDARNYQVFPFAAPTDEERAQHYLWRFWRHLPRAGRITIFDRSWYGRVLVERVEGLATEQEWHRAYAEINDLERQLTEYGIILLKYWIHISKDEQLKRFREREEIPHKRWKITGEDWRNREKWEPYERAAHDMIQRTSTHDAPWALINGNDKYYSRVKVIQVFTEALEAALDEGS